MRTAVPTFATETDAAIPLHLLPAGDALESGLAALPESARDWVTRCGFSAAVGETMLAPDGASGAVAVVGHGTDAARARVQFTLAAGARGLPVGTYRLASHPLDGPALAVESLGWLLASYAFDIYRDQGRAPARLIAPAGVDVSALEALAAGECLTRDLINTPASDMGPAELQATLEQLGVAHGATVTAIVGDALLDQNLPMIHAVGRAAASDRAPRLLDLRWGDAGPTLTLVGKGVCFDTGGLNLKPGASMGLMKKDMGGAATVLGLAHMIMAQGWPVRLRVLIPAVENSVSGPSFRPGDILTARNGLTVEINNTDAEGRLVLADALALAAEEGPGRLISMATLTGAARVAVGPDLSPFFTDDAALAGALPGAGESWADPVWRLPFHAPYEAMIEPGIADLDNAPKGGFAGSITAALFLRRFAGEGAAYTHFDIYGWNPTAAPGRPKGGAGMGARALFGALPNVMSL
jgi:leucyl aminopeptidase